MRTHLPNCLAATLALWACAAPAAADTAPQPSLTRVDYRDGAALVALPDSAGGGKRALSLANQLKGGTPRETLAQIARWTNRNLRGDEQKGGSWRGVDQILEDGTQGGPADLALVVGILARAAGIPTTWVKSVPVAWISAYREGGAKLEDAGGRVFLEVAIDGRWRLLDPVESRIYEVYDPRSPLLPGEHLAYDKGADPYALVLPNRRELWQRQARDHFSRMDLAGVPWAQTTELLARWTVFVTGKGGAASYARAAARTLGFNVERTFDSQYELYLPRARGKTLIVTCEGTRPHLPEKYWAALLPPGYAEIVQGTQRPERGWVAHRLPDGTRVILVTASEFGPVELAVSEALEG